jgi:O-succinylbenzoate synthase
MKVEGIELVRVGLRLREPVGTSAGSHHDRPVVYVRVATDRGEGWGECGALASATAVDPGVDDVWHSVVDVGAPRLLAAASARGGRLPPAAQVAPMFNLDGVGRMTGALLEMAVLDAELRAAGTSLRAHLGGGSGPVAAGTVVGLPADRRIEAVVAQADRAVERGYRRVRVKIAPGFDLWPLAAVRERHPELPLQADANGAYRLDVDGELDARQLRALDPLGLTCIEQPLPAPDLAAHAELASQLDTPIALGGLLAARTAAARCRAAGARAFVGGFFETGLARSAHAALAALPGFDLPGDLADPATYLDEDPCGFPPVASGQLTPFETPGVGPWPDAGVLERRTTVRTWVSART